jgi:hypothetical protein
VLRWWQSLLLGALCLPLLPALLLLLPLLAEPAVREAADDNQARVMQEHEQHI